MLLRVFSWIGLLLFSKHLRLRHYLPVATPSGSVVVPTVRFIHFLRKAARDQNLRDHSFGHRSITTFFSQ